MAPSEEAHWGPHRSPGTMGLWDYLGNYIVNFNVNDGSPIPELYQLLEAQRREIDVARRKDLVMKVQERVWSLYPQVWLHTRETYLLNQGWVVVRPSVYRRWGEPASIWINR